jgi:hypothetical protein
MRKPKKQQKPLNDLSRSLTPFDPNQALIRGKVRLQNCLVDHLVGASEQGGRDGESKRPGGLQVDDKREFR